MQQTAYQLYVLQEIYIPCFLREPRTNKKKQTNPNLHLFTTEKKKVSNSKEMSTLQGRVISISIQRSFLHSFLVKCLAKPPWYISCPSPRAGFPCLEWHMNDTNRVKGKTPKHFTGDIQNFPGMNLCRTHLLIWLFIAIYVIKRDF